MTRPWRSQQRRRRLALLACLLWLAGFEVLPWAHIAFHDRIGHHHHDVGGIVVDGIRFRVDFTTTDVEHHDHVAPNDGLARLAENLAHGRHSFAHHDLAAIPTAPPLTSPLPIDRRAITLAIARAIEPVSFSPGRAVARGPPRVRST